MTLVETPIPDRTGDTPEAALRRLRHVLDVCTALNTVSCLGDLLGRIVRATTVVLRCEAAAVLLYDEAEGSLRFAAATGDPAGALADVVVPLHGSLAGTIVRENRPLLAADLDGDPDHFATAAARTGLHARVLLGVPMRTDGQPVGVLEAINPLGGSFDRADVETLQAISSQAAVALRSARQVAELEVANAQLEALDRARSNFMTIASHELRTPITIVRGYAEVLAEEVAPELRPYVDEVIEAGQRMQEVAETVEVMATLRDDLVDLDLHPVPLAGLIDDVCGEAGRPVEVDGIDRALCVAADRRRLRLALKNLVANAAQFTPGDGRIVVSARADGASVLLDVADTGCGLAAGDLERIFEPFVQAEEAQTRVHEGLGLGLAVARSIARKHGGDLWATSGGPGRGSTFHLRLLRAD